MTAAVQHDAQVSEDYGLLTTMGMRTARDGLRWHLIEHAGQYDFSSWAPMLEAAQSHGIQVIWDICHYGWPDDLDIFSPQFIDRFAKFCRAAARFHREHNDEVPFYCPVNEISFFSWAACRRLIHPYAHGRDGELKQQLVRAVIAGAEALWEVDSRARLVFPEPLIHNVPPRKHPENTEPSRIQRASQFEAFDMISGRAFPELGGHSRYLDIVGVNFYAANQWEVPGGKKLQWDAGSDDERWMPLRLLLAEVYERYHRPLLIAETSHYGTGRAAWIREIAQEVHAARVNCVPVEGVCLYPILDRFDWEDRRHWHNSGLWDIEKDANGHYLRKLNEEYAAALREAQSLMGTVGC